MWKCKHCSEQIDDSFDACWSCGYSRDGSPPTEPFEAQHTADSLGRSFDKPRGKGSKSRDTERANSIAKRYRDAYLEARAIIGFGSIVKGIGIILGIIILVLSISGDRNNFGLFGVIIALVIGVVFYVLGLLISAAGQILQATLDTAINTSEFLTRDQRASVMSLK
jgi:hypothetical protein